MPVVIDNKKHIDYTQVKIRKEGKRERLMNQTKNVVTGVPTKDAELVTPVIVEDAELKKAQEELNKEGKGKFKFKR